MHFAALTFIVLYMHKWFDMVEECQSESVEWNQVKRFRTDVTIAMLNYKQTRKSMFVLTVQPLCSNWWGEVESRTGASEMLTQWAQSTMERKKKEKRELRPPIRPTFVWESYIIREGNSQWNPERGERRPQGCYTVAVLAMTAGMKCMSHTPRPETSPPGVEDGVLDWKLLNCS